MKRKYCNWKLPKAWFRQKRKAFVSVFLSKVSATGAFVLHRLSKLFSIGGGLLSYHVRFGRGLCLGGLISRGFCPGGKGLRPTPIWTWRKKTTVQWLYNTLQGNEQQQSQREDFCICTHLPQHDTDWTLTTRHANSTVDSIYQYHAHNAGTNDRQW